MRGYERVTNGLYSCWCGRLHATRLSTGACTHDGPIPHQTPTEPMQPDYEVEDVSWREAMATLAVLAAGLLFFFTFWAVLG